ncbi:unnamed protein product, partial [Rotaria socialis]
NTEVRIQHGEYKTIQGETRLVTGGSRGTKNYKDIRQFVCQYSSARLIYIHLPTTMGQSAIRNINYLQTLKDCNCIHAIIFSSYHSDLNFAKLVKSELPFNDLLNNFNSALNDVCHHLIGICKNKKYQHQQFIWLGPNPIAMQLNSEQQYQFDEILNRTNEIVRRHNFHLFDRYFYWNKIRHNLLLPNSNYFGPKGVRLMTQLLTEIIGKKWNRSLSIPIIIPPIPMRLTPLQIQEQHIQTLQHSSQELKWPKPTFYKKRFDPINYQK